MAKLKTIAGSVNSKVLDGSEMAYVQKKTFQKIFEGLD